MATPFAPKQLSKLRQAQLRSLTPRVAALESGDVEWSGHLSRCVVRAGVLLLLLLLLSSFSVFFLFRRGACGYHANARQRSYA